MHLVYNYHSTLVHFIKGKTIKSGLALSLFFLMGGLSASYAQSCTAPSQCSSTPGFGEAPAGISCAEGFGPKEIFLENFDNGFGIFTEEAAINAGSSTNDLTLSTAGDTPSFGTGPETTAGCSSAQ